MVRDYYRKKNKKLFGDYEEISEVIGALINVHSQRIQKLHVA